MKPDNLVQQKSYAFALRMVKLHRHLAGQKKEFVLSRQVLRSGTSIGANVEEAIGGQSGRDFAFKMSIAYKEARETHYWLRLLRDSGYLDGPESSALLADCEELLKVTGSIIKTMKEKNNE
jgi:four helix bundle protein